jgi:ERCC4-related helicase
VRAYQLELIAPALLGHNTCATAPTGSGKTLAAAELIERTIAARRARGIRTRVVFVVPTVPLVEQQRRVLHGQLCHVTCVTAIHATDGLSDDNQHNDSTTRTGRVLAAGVVVMTAQICV